MIATITWSFARCRQVLVLGLAALLIPLVAASAAPAFRPSAAVLPFQNVSIYSGHMLARRAADQLALSLGGTGTWRVIDRTQTDRALQQRELAPPYAVAYLQEIAHALEADVVFTGAVQKLEVDAKLGLLKVTVLVEAVDRIAGQTLLASVQTGEVRRNETKPQPTDVLIGEALANALDKMAALAGRDTGLLTTVAAPQDGKSVSLKRSDNDTIHSGQRFLLYRATVDDGQKTPGKLIATVMVTDVSADSYKAQVLARSGDIHTDDFVVSIGSSEPPATP